ncbi:DinB family protein [Flavobacterium sp. DG1-102-2]|uniref:DinB family protein n=1 Tax=Flavobacterium sp. DG1-102-2 TaxID=3081663 RepID=UPI002948CE5B|nr:DinB family protein [Flavobacterium sp. DG1-102-2]MDV6167602.1 DinB family protein [Flavobacterium sp. DG1-102-2]
METKTAAAQTAVINSEAFLKHWQAHRGLTRRVIEAFPEKDLFLYSIGGMRPFVQLAMEIIDLTNPGIVGLVTNEWKNMNELPHSSGEGVPTTKEELLVLWDETTQQLERYWAKFTPDRFEDKVLAFGTYEGKVASTLFYFVDNEIHHRGQGYVYLRALGIEPPYFWQR